MTNRKKRLKKGIESLQEQIEIHKEKKKHAEEEGDEDLTRYYIKEIEAKEKAREEKQALLDKQ
jgi:hypothetical protein